MKKYVVLSICLLLLTSCVKSNEKVVISVNDCNVKIEKDNMDIIKKLKENKYFICNNLDKYLSYSKIESNIDNIVSEVNAGLWRNFYHEKKESDISKNNLVLVNKYYYLPSDYEPDDLEEIRKDCNVGLNNMLRHEAKEMFEQLCLDAKKEGLNIYNSSAYRSYSNQESVYNKYLMKKGIAEADKYSARKGHSEHQSGLVVDINTVSTDFSYTKEYDWMKKNAYKYGFIERYSKYKEKLTGYSYESWHYRYVGVEVAKFLNDEDITFDEYYAYYIEN